MKKILEETQEQKLLRDVINLSLFLYNQTKNNEENKEDTKDRLKESINKLLNSFKTKEI